MKIARIALIVVGLITLVMGVMGANMVMYGVADPMWHAAFKIVRGSHCSRNRSCINELKARNIQILFFFCSVD